ncbi:MAG: catechol 2,3-dioxygenase-like lactoylglutathione lyase family enzyme [Myxococcota bacterium]|jgi:catechol 2,3-dioxygenase-like lactoylglutathione lyase family enzyme
MENSVDELALCLDHTSLSVSDLARASAFFQAALAPLGIGIVANITAKQSGSVAFTGFGFGRKGSLWLAETGQQTPASHICFRAKDHAQVRAFYDAALAAGGVCNGAPGARAHYHPEYYAAFVRDPEGHNIEAVAFIA